MAQETVVEILAKFRADIADFNKKLNTVQKELDDVKRATETTAKDISSSFDAMGNAANRFATKVGAVAAVAGGALVAMGIQSFRTAAEVQELDTVMQVVGATTGVTYKVLKDTADAIRGNGIEMASAQQMAIKFAKNQLNLADAANVARVAQDLAVISQANSTETADRLTYAVLNLNSMMLRNAGVQTTVSQAVKAYAAENKISAGSMTTAQKQQAVLNAILEEGKKISGVYTMSMTNAGKVLRSFARITKDIQGELGGAFLDALGPIILKFYDLYKAFSLTLREGGALYPIIQALSAVFVNLAIPLGNALDKAIEFIKNMKPMSTSVSELGDTIQRYLPIIAAAGAALATIGGASLLANVPILGAFLGMLNPVAVALTVLVALSPKVRDAFINLFDALKPLGPVLLTVGKVIMDVLNIALHYLSVAVNMAADAVRFIITFVQNNKEVFITLAKIIGVLTLAYFAYMAQVILVNAATKAWAVITGIATAVTKGFRTAVLMLNAAMRMNPIGLLIAAITLLVAGFVVAWNSSDKFRKIVVEGMKGAVMAVGYLIKAVGWLGESYLKVVTGPMRLFLKGLAFIKAPGAQAALDGINGAIESVGTFFDNAGNKVQDFADKLDGLKDKKFNLSMPKFDSGFKMPKIDPKKIFEGLKADSGTEKGGGAGEGVKGVTNNLREAIQKYNDFINNEFVLGFQKDSETARDTVIKSLSMLKGVFDEQAKGLKGTALKNLEDAYWKTDAVIRQFIPQAEELGAAFDLINKEIDLANDEFKKVTADRESAVAEFAKLMRQPFGEPSQLTKALSSAEASVDSIIGMYDSLVEQINKRYAGIDPTGRDDLIKYLTNQTQMLVDLAKKRLIAAENLQKAQQALDEVVAEQKQFAADVKGSLSGFATALADISTADSAAVIQVIKTSTGLVITQMQESSSGVNKITDQLRQRLAAIQDFARNIKSLLAQGLNKDYIRQLLEAGPEAAGQTAQLLATVGSDQISEINSLYSQIGSVSEVFSRDMADLFYGGAVASAKSIRDGYQSEYDGIMTQMNSIKTGIEEKLKPLSLLGSNLGKDLAQGLLDSLTAKKSELIALAESIAVEIAAALAKAGLGIGVGLDTLKVTKTPDVTPSPFAPSTQSDRQNWDKYNPDVSYNTTTTTTGAFDINITKTMTDSEVQARLESALRGVMVAR